MAKYGECRYIYIYTPYMDCLGKIPTSHERILAKTGISSDDHKDTRLLKTLPGVWRFASFFLQRRKAWPQMNNGVQLYSWILLKMIGKKEHMFSQMGGKTDGDESMVQSAKKVTLNKSKYVG